MLRLQMCQCHLQVTESGEKILCVLKWVGHLHFKESFQASWLVPIRSVEPSLASCKSGAAI